MKRTRSCAKVVFKRNREIWYFRQTFRVIANTVDILTALSREPIQWNAKSQLQCIFHCIAIHFTRVQAFPSDCNTFDQKCNPMCCIEFNLIQSERIKCDLYCVQRSLYDLPKCTSCVQEPIVLLCSCLLRKYFFAEKIIFWGQIIFCSANDLLLRKSFLSTDD